MQRFKSYMTEQFDPAAAFEKARAISIYLSGRQKETFEAALDAFIAGSNAKAIYNAKFSDHYTYGLSRGIEKAWDTCRSADWEGLRATIPDGEQWDLYSFSGLNGLKKFEKAWTPHKAAYPKQWAFIEAIRDIPEAVKVLKTYLIKGKPKAEPKPGQFVKPMASTDANKKAIAFLNDAVTSFKVQFHASVRDQFMKDFEKIKASTLEDLKKAPSQVQSLAARIGHAKTAKAGEPKAFVLLPDAENIVLKLADNIVSDIIEQFVAKNTSKLALIFQKKAEVTKHTIINTRIQNNTLENKMYFEFNDGSSFKIDSQVIFKYSSTGKPFMQFPTRFTDVTMADGTKMKMPSEEKMIKEF